MYLHLGSDTVVNTKNIISIMDLETTSRSKDSKEFLKTAEEEGFVRNVSDEIPKAFIICEIDGQSVIYITNISSKTLELRVNRYKKGNDKRG